MNILVHNFIHIYGIYSIYTHIRTRNRIAEEPNHWQKYPKSNCRLAVRFRIVVQMPTHNAVGAYTWSQKSRKVYADTYVVEEFEVLRGYMNKTTGFGNMAFQKIIIALRFLNEI